MVFLPKLAYTTDNAAMIAAAGYYNYYQNKDNAFLNYRKLKADPNLKL